MRHLQRLGNQIRIPIPSDEEGFVGRECPAQDCLGYFKIKLGTGLKGENLPCYCPYCGYKDGPDKFWTQDQIEYARSVALSKITQALKQDIQDWGRQLRQSTRKSFIKLDVQYKGRHHPIRYYQEKELETKIVCDNCTLHYVIYGVFGHCPDCGVHNSLQILNKNLELATKELNLASTVEDQELTTYLLGDALENAVAAFDGFGRETSRIYASFASEPDKVENISFQNLTKANQRLQVLFGFDLMSGLPSSEWDLVSRCFQKRHLLAHKMGIIDEAYINASKDSQAIAGRKVSISAEEITRLIDALRKLGSYFTTHLCQATIRRRVSRNLCERGNQAKEIEA